RFTGHEGNVAAVAFAPDGQTLASSAADHTVRLWSVKDGKELRRFTIPAKEQLPPQLAFAGAATLVAGNDWALRFWDVATGRLLGETKSFGNGAYHALALTRDGKTVAYAGHDGVAELWDVATRKRLLAPAGPHADVFHA